MLFSVLILGMWGWARVEEAGKCVCVGAHAEFAEFLTSGLEHCLALPTVWPGQHTAGTVKCGLLMFNSNTPVKNFYSSILQCSFMYLSSSPSILTLQILFCHHKRILFFPSSVMSCVLSFPVVVPKEPPSSLLTSHFPWEKVSGGRKLRGIGPGK